MCRLYDEESSITLQDKASHVVKEKLCGGMFLSASGFFSSSSDCYVHVAHKSLNIVLLPAF